MAAKKARSKSGDRKLGERVRAAYIKEGYNRSQFARALDVAYTTVISWEKGDKAPNQDNLRRIAELTKTSTDALLGVATLELDSTVPQVVEDVIAELGDRLSANAKATLRATNWHHSGLSVGTVRSYAMDLMLDEQGKATSKPESVKTKLRPGRRRIK